MGLSLLNKLSNADSIASNEQEVRDLLKEELIEYSESFQFDRIGSFLVSKKSNISNAPTIMFAAHMDEVGFMVRYISPIGLIYVIPIGGVENRAKSMQMVRIKTYDGKKVKGLLNVVDDQIYIDVGVDSEEEALDLGIDVGNMVCFDTNYYEVGNYRVAGKAMDDRSGCWALSEAMKEINNIELGVNVVAAFTSSEEVGTRGGKLVTKLIKPDLFFAVDVAKNPELDRDFRNTRRLGYGPMLEFYDKTMVPNPKLVKKVRDIAAEHQINYQKDMFKGGGTDAGTAHLENFGTAAMVLGIPLRYCHDPYSFAAKEDLVGMKNLIVKIVETIKSDFIKEVYKF